jgi:hypothetical protein
MKLFFNKVDINEDNNLLLFLHSISDNNYHLPLNIVDLVYEKFNITPSYWVYSDFEKVSTIFYHLCGDEIYLYFHDNEFYELFYGIYPSTFNVI